MVIADTTVFLFVPSMLNDNKKENQTSNLVLFFQLIPPSQHYHEVNVKEEGFEVEPVCMSLSSSITMNSSNNQYCL